MRTTWLLAGLGLFAFHPSARAAGVDISIHFDAPPPVVEVNPGVSVVEDNDEQIFFTSGFYWVARDGVWYRTRDWHGGWTVIATPRVPVFVRNSPPGRYVHWKHEEHERKEERKEERHEEHEQHEHGHGRH